MGNIKSLGYAGKNTTDDLEKWEFERKELGEFDILVDIRYCGVCHSDIHFIKGDYGEPKFPLVPGHEITGIVTQIGSGVSKFKVGDRVGIGCIYSSCGKCTNCDNGEEHLCNEGMMFTYGDPDPESPTGMTQGGYSINYVINENYVIKIPDNISLEHAAPLLCAGITTYSPMMRHRIRSGDKIGVIGIGGLGHIAIKLAISFGAEVYAFTTSKEKVESIKKMGVKEVICVDSPDKLAPYEGMMDYAICTIPYEFDLSLYASIVRPYGYFTLIGMPSGDFADKVNNFALACSRVNYAASFIGGIPETQEVLNYCAEKNIHPNIQIITPEEINTAWQNVIDKKSHFRYVIDMTKLK